ncbi:MAG: exosortase/archaeosortase family protein [Candidatus Micrarchaeota archaeon]
MTFKFVSLFLLIAGIAYFTLSSTKIMQYVAAISSQFALKALYGLDSSIAFSQFPSPNPVILTPRLSAEIVDLCAGILELAVLAGIVFASFEKKMGYRIKGFALGLLLLLVFNALRISTTIYYFDLGNLEWSAALHDFLFRLLLIVVIVTYYAIWYFYDIPRKKRKRNRRHK